MSLKHNVHVVVYLDDVESSAAAQVREIKRKLESYIIECDVDCSFFWGCMGDAKIYNFMVMRTIPRIKVV